MNNINGQDDFYSAVSRARIQAILDALRWDRPELLSFYEVTSLIKPSRQTYLGMRTIPIAKIIGSEGRYHDFSSSFYPKNTALKDRWVSIDNAMHEDIILPPISVYKLGDNYFVRDGNHRVSVAKTTGAAFIDAEVVELDTEIPLRSGMTTREIKDEVVAYERHRFMDEYKPDYLPMDKIVFTKPGCYPELVNHILVHKYYINQNQREEIQFKVAALSWYANVYLPIVKEIRESRFLKNFPGKTEADAYLWVVRVWDSLKRSGNQQASIQQAAQEVAEKRKKGFFSRWFSYLKSRLSRS